MYFFYRGTIKSIVTLTLTGCSMAPLPAASLCSSLWEQLRTSSVSLLNIYNSRLTSKSHQNCRWPRPPMSQSPGQNQPAQRAVFSTRQSGCSTLSLRCPYSSSPRPPPLTLGHRFQPRTHSSQYCTAQFTPSCLHYSALVLPSNSVMYLMIVFILQILVVVVFMYYLAAPWSPRKLISFITHWACVAYLIMLTW